MILRKAGVNDISAMTAVFVSAVGESAAHYSAMQRAALVTGTTRQSFWTDLLQRDYTIAAFEMGMLVGFCSFSTRGEVTMLYVHPTMQRKGIGTRMLMHLKDYASHEGYAHLKIDAVPAFSSKLERMGFEKIEDVRREERGVAFDYALYMLDLL
jgi:putative acetyltransferase